MWLHFTKYTVVESPKRSHNICIVINKRERRIIQETDNMTTIVLQAFVFRIRKQGSCTMIYSWFESLSIRNTDMKTWDVSVFKWHENSIVCKGWIRAELWLKNFIFLFRIKFSCFAFLWCFQFICWHKILETLSNVKQWE